MKIEELKKELDSAVSKSMINTDMLIGRLKFMDLKSKKSSQYADSKYLPPYYHLSKFISPVKIVQIGFDLAFPLCCFLKSNNSAKEILAFQPKGDDDSYYSERLGISNLREIKKEIEINFYKGGVFDIDFQNLLSQKKWDCFFINEKYGKFDSIKENLDLSWDNLNDDGFIILDGIMHKKVNKLFKDFCKIRNTFGIEIKTRYGLGIIRK